MAKKSKKVSDILLGSISSQIVGIQFYEGDIKSGEEVIFEREPDNPHDKNAVRVDNLDFKQIGNLPRNLVTWLSPLIDAGKVRIKGKALQDNISGNNEKRYNSPLLLNIYLCPKGKGILHENKHLQNDLEALHEVVRKTFNDVDQYCDSEITISLGERLSQILNREVLPETHLLLALFPSKTEK